MDYSLVLVTRVPSYLRGFLQQVAGEKLGSSIRKVGGRMERERGCRKSMSRDGHRPPNSRKVKSPTNTCTDLALCDLGGAGVSLCPDSTKGRTCSLKLVFSPSRIITDMLVCRNHVQL